MILETPLITRRRALRELLTMGMMQTRHSACVVLLHALGPLYQEPRWMTFIIHLLEASIVTRIPISATLAHPELAMTQQWTHHLVSIAM